MAAASAREVAAQRGARLVHAAAALLGVEEAADTAKQLVGLAPHGILVAPALDRELDLRLREGQVEMPRQPLHIALVERDERVGAAVAGTLLAVIHGVAVVPRVGGIVQNGSGPRSASRYEGAFHVPAR